LDTNGNVFGGFTPVKWDSREWKHGFGLQHNWFQADDSLKSFLFTLKNPHNIPARRFALESKEKSWAIRCDSQWGPWFGGDMGVWDNCSTNMLSATNLGNAYINDTGLDGDTVFTGSQLFQVKEIEVFEIIE
jgi:hypothetical protein